MHCFSPACWKSCEVCKINFRAYFLRTHCLHHVPCCLWCITTLGIGIYIVDGNHKREGCFLVKKIKSMRFAVTII